MLERVNKPMFSSTKDVAKKLDIKEEQLVELYDKGVAGLKRAGSSEIEWTTDCVDKIEKIIKKARLNVMNPQTEDLLAALLRETLDKVGTLMRNETDHSSLAAEEFSNIHNKLNERVEFERSLASALESVNDTLTSLKNEFESFKESSESNFNLVWEIYSHLSSPQANKVVTDNAQPDLINSETIGAHNFVDFDQIKYSPVTDKEVAEEAHKDYVDRARNGALDDPKMGKLMEVSNCIRDQIDEHWDSHREPLTMSEIAANDKANGADHKNIRLAALGWLSKSGLITITNPRSGGRPSSCFQPKQSFN